MPMLRMDFPAYDVSLIDERLNNAPQQANSTYWLHLLLWQSGIKPCQTLPVVSSVFLLMKLCQGADNI